MLAIVKCKIGFEILLKWADLSNSISSKAMSLDSTLHVDLWKVEMCWKPPSSGLVSEAEEHVGDEDLSPVSQCES